MSDKHDAGAQRRKTSITASLNLAEAQEVGARPRVLTNLRDKEMEGIRAALAEVEHSKEAVVEGEGLTVTNFVAGVLNLLFCTYFMGAYPEHFWVLYAVQAWILVGAWWYTVATREGGIFYMMDFCWMGNAIFSIYMGLLLLDVVPMFMRHWLFVAFYGSVMGPMHWAALLLNSGLVFHDVVSTASTFIHTFPCWVCMIIQLQPELFEQNWPGRFPTQAQWQATSWREVWTIGATFYFTWWAVHSTWLLTIGQELPGMGYKTVFNNLYNNANLAPKLTKLTGSENKRMHTFAYLLIHAFACQTGYMFATWTWQLKYLGPAFGCFVWICVVRNGARHYDFLFSKKYTLVLEQLISEREASRGAKKD